MEHRMFGLRQFEEEGWIDRIRPALAALADQDVLARIWEHDHTVWKSVPAEITNRLGWLTIAPTMSVHTSELQDFAQSVRGDGFSQVVLLGMGGSSLAPEVFRETFGVAEGYLGLSVLDSTDPAAVADLIQSLELEQTLFIVSTKSGGTVETLSFFKFFYNQVAEKVGRSQAGNHFVAITDPGSSLADLADHYEFRRTFLNDPNIGGRYSALSFFGLVPAALIGVDISLLLDRAVAMSHACGPSVDTAKNPAALLGALMGQMAEDGQDKATFLIAPSIGSFGDWVEQLIAESTGKDGKGILPVVGENLVQAGLYGNDRLFFQIGLDGEEEDFRDSTALAEEGHPVLSFRLRDRYDLGGQFFLWEMATSVAGHILGINPFDQPNVEAAKVLARQMVAEYESTGSLPSGVPILEKEGIAVYGDLEPGQEGDVTESAGQSLTIFLDQAQSGDYVALQAYVQPTPDNEVALQALRNCLQTRLKVATTVGYGPRFLHSTGQLHKGDSGNGLFIQIIANATQDLAIPDQAGSPESSITFGVLEKAQWMGDRQALLEAGRRAIAFQLDDVGKGLSCLADSLA